MFHNTTQYIKDTLEVAQAPFYLLDDDNSSLYTFEDSWGNVRNPLTNMFPPKKGVTNIGLPRYPRMRIESN